MTRHIRSDAAWVAVLYALAAAVWIAVSDRAAGSLAGDPSLLTRLQTLKGGLFIGVTALLLYTLVERAGRRYTALLRALESGRRASLAEVGDSRRARAESEARLQAVFDQAAVGIGVLDVDGTWVEVNERMAGLLGVPRERLRGASFSAAAHPDDAAANHADFEALLAGGVPWLSRERRYVRPDGSTGWARVTVSTVPGDAGAPAQLVVVAEDIRSRKAIERALHETIGRYMALVESAPIAIFVNRGGRIELANRACQELFGARCREDLLGRDALSLFHPESHEGARERIAALLERRAATGFAEARAVRLDGGLTHVEVAASPFADGDGDALHVVVRDVSERKRHEARLRLAATVFTSSQEGVVVTEADGTIVAVNPAFTAITGHPEAEVVGQNMRIMRSGRHDADFYRAMWSTLAASGTWQGEIWNRRRNGEVFPQWLTIRAVRDVTDVLTNYVGVFTDISRLKHSEARVDHLVQHDVLTDLPNRSLLLSRLEHAVARVGGRGGLGAVLCLDLDAFNTINDSLGHPAGDEVICRVAARLGAALREGDTLARLGGDDFVVVLEDLADARDAAAAALRLVDSLSDPIVLGDGEEVYVGASVGISLFPTDASDADTLIQHADAALVLAKGTDRGAVCFYTEELTRGAEARLRMEGRLRRALARREFVLHYQPLVAGEENRVVGVEALIRWADPVDGLVPPSMFIPHAEENGLIVPIGEWALREACAQMKRWVDEGLPLRTMAVNLSPRQFRHDGLIDAVGRVLAETGLDPGFLELEITETAMMDRAERSLADLHALKGLGVRLALDDFGTGYSSLAYLKRFPIDKLKVDQSFVRHIPDDRADMEIAATIIAMAKNLHLHVLAEGVETEAQLAFLKAQGCDAFQGWLFSKALPADALRRLVLAEAQPRVAAAS